MQAKLTRAEKTAKIENMMMNPLIRKLSGITETSDTAATYQGIAAKVAFFMGMIMLGVVLSAIHLSVDPLTYAANGEVTGGSPLMLIALAVSAVMMIVLPLVAFLIRPAIPVAGALYCAANGYLIGFIAAVFVDQRVNILLALVITAAIVGVMAVLYAKGWARPTKKVRTVISVCFGAAVVSSLLVFLASLVPGVKSVAEAIMGDALGYTVIGLLFVVIASLMLLVDFGTIQQAVENRLPRKYEWIAAFGLAFSVIWLFLKVLDLIGKSSKKNG